MSTRREGIALIAVVLALVILEAAIAGALFLATLEATTTRSLIGHTRAALAAESGLATALAGWDAAVMTGLAVHDTIAPTAGAMIDGASMAATVEHVWPAAYVVTGRGTIAAPAAPAAATAAALVHWFAPAAFTAATPAALTVGGTATLHTGSTVHGDSSVSTCPPADALALSTFPPAAGVTASHAGAVQGAAASSIAGSPLIQIAAAATDSAAFARVGPADAASLALRATHTATGTIALAPATVGTRCDTAAASNWGAPDSPPHPCADYVPLVYAPTDLTILSGTGQALLIAAGDLTLQPAAELHGLVLVLGNATIHGRIHGALRVRGDAVIHGEIRREPCALWRALTRPGPLARPHRATARWRLPAF